MSTLNNQSVLAFAQNQRDEVRDLNDVAGSLAAEPGIKQQTFIAYGISSYDSNAMKSPNPHSGIYEADTSRTLDLNGGNPACNQGGIAVLAVDCRNGREGEINGTLQAKSTGGMSLNLNNVIRTRTDT